MADTIRETIIQAIVDSVDGYTFTALAGADVYRGRIRFQEQLEDLPLISVIPRQEEAGIGNYGQSLCTMEVVVGAIAAIGAANPSELAEAVHGELIKAAFRVAPADARKMAYAGGGIEQYPDELGQPLLAVSITLAVEYETDLGDPYTLST